MSSVENIKERMTSFRQMIDSDETRSLFSLEYINALLSEIDPVEFAPVIEIDKKIELLRKNFILQQNQNADKLKNLEAGLESVEEKLQRLHELLSKQAVPLTEIKAHSEKVKNAKQAVNASMKAASIFAQEKEEETHRGTRYLAIKARYLEQIYPIYNDALLKANEFVRRAEQAERVSRLYHLLQTVMSDTNIKKYWCKQIICLPSTIDGSRVRVDGIDIRVPRGICRAHQELGKLTDDSSNLYEAVRQACLRMRDRLGNEEDDEKATTKLYSAAAGFLEGDKLVVTEENLLYFVNTLLNNKIFQSLIGIESFQLSAHETPAFIC